MKTILITGASGLIGKRLTEILLHKGFIVRHLSRKKGDGTIPTFIWNVEKKEIDMAAFENADAIIHLAGINLSERRWTIGFKKKIYDSRIEGSKLIVEALRLTPNKIKVIVSVSGINYYAEEKGKPLTEDSKPANDFLGKVCVDWENEIRKAEEINIRTVQLRTGIVLAENGGAMKELIKQLKLRIKPIFLPGSQIYSWVHLDDVCNSYIHAIKNETMNGAYNVVAPNPVSYNTLINEIAKFSKRKSIPAPVMKWMIKIIVGEFGVTLFQSMNCSCEKIKAIGFQFQFPELNDAMKDIFKK